MKTIITIYIVYVLVILYINYADDDEARMRLWQMAATVCQKVAYGFGRAGLYAEHQYHLSRSSVL